MNNYRNRAEKKSRKMKTKIKVTETVETIRKIENIGRMDVLKRRY